MTDRLAGIQYLLNTVSSQIRMYREKLLDIEDGNWKVPESEKQGYIQKVEKLSKEHDILQGIIARAEKQ